MKQKHFAITDFHEDNWHLYEIEPDPDFSPEHNYAVIQKTIEDYEKMRYGIDEKVQRAAEDKADILASFAKYKLDQGGEKKIEQFLGKKRMAEIYGEKLLEKIRLLESTKRLNEAKGNDKFKDYYLK